MIDPSNENTGFGKQTFFQVTTGQYNSAFGSLALYFNSGGYYNVAAGYQALYKNTSGYENNAFGMMALYNNTTGYENTAIGRNALGNNLTGNFNVSIGHNSNSLNTINSYNTSVGSSSGDIYTYSNGTFLGANAYPSVDGLTTCMALGYEARVNAPNKVVIGNSSVTSIGGYANWTNFSDGRFKKNLSENVPGLAFICRLRPVTYTLDIQSLNADLEKNKPSGMHDGD